MGTRLTYLDLMGKKSIAFEKPFFFIRETFKCFIFDKQGRHYKNVMRNLMELDDDFDDRVQTICDQLNNADE